MSMLELYLNKILPLSKTQTAWTDVSETVEIKFNKYGKRAVPALLCYYMYAVSNLLHAYFGRCYLPSHLNCLDKYCLMEKH